jgi:hypothetical protein
MSRQQAELAERVEELSKSVEDIARAMEAAGLNDTAFPGAAARGQALPRAGDHARDGSWLPRAAESPAEPRPEATRMALERLAEAQRRLKEELDAARSLRRAAMEGALTSLAEDARDLRAEQQVEPERRAARRQRGRRRRTRWRRRAILPRRREPRAATCSLLANWPPDRRRRGRSGRQGDASRGEQALQGEARRRRRCGGRKPRGTRETFRKS